MPPSVIALLPDSPLQAVVMYMLQAELFFGRGDSFAGRNTGNLASDAHSIPRTTVCATCCSALLITWELLCYFGRACFAMKFISSQLQRRVKISVAILLDNHDSTISQAPHSVLKGTVARRERGGLTFNVKYAAADQVRVTPCQ